MPRVLSDTDVADFRERLCEAAERLFAERGPDAVTMRQLAAELGVSPMTPYRYFEDKDDILAAVRASGFERFAEALETAYASTDDPIPRSMAVAEAYRHFAFEHPQTYKLMFDLNQPNQADYPGLVAAAARARATMTQHVEGLAAGGVVSGDIERIGMMFWSSAHGAVVLELAGKLPHGASEFLVRELCTTLLKGLTAKA